MSQIGVLASSRGKSPNLRGKSLPEVKGDRGRCYKIGISSILAKIFGESIGDFIENRYYEIFLSA
jgi:hypothetical protein